MSKCKNCNLEILDHTVQCPFCHFVLENGAEEVSTMYPDVSGKAKQFRLAENIVLFVSILAVCICGIVNYMVGASIPWSLIVGLAVLYGNIVLRFAVVGKSGYMFKTIFLVVVAILVLIGIDYLAGYRGWAVNYVLPSGILVVDFAILLVMIINHRNWQSYIMVQLLTIVMSLVPLIMYFVGVIQHVILVNVALGVSVFLFLGTVIIGDRKAVNELKRRFYI